MNKEHTLKAELQYLVPSEQKPVYYASQGGKEAELTMDGNFEIYNVPIHNARYSRARKAHWIRRVFP
jgi:hypothetical protein